MMHGRVPMGCPFPGAKTQRGEGTSTLYSPFARNRGAANKTRKGTRLK